jgi:hypothetical protein
MGSLQNRATNPDSAIATASIQHTLPANVQWGPATNASSRQYRMMRHVSTQPPDTVKQNSCSFIWSEWNWQWRRERAR